MQFFIKVLSKIIFIVTILNMVGCNGDSSGGSNSDGSNQLVAGNLVIEGTDSVGIQASEGYTISLVNSHGVTTPVYVTSNLPITTQVNNSVVRIASDDDCINGLTTKNPSCTIYISGVNAGRAKLEVTAPNYNKVSKSLSVTKQWGGIGGVTPTGNIKYILFNSNTIYIAGDLKNVYASIDGRPWSLVGGGDAMGDGEIGNDIAIDDSHICVLRQTNTKILYDPAIVRCSVGNGKWITLPTPLSPKLSVDKMSLDNKGQVYVAGWIANGGGSVVYTCNIDNCVDWNLIGKSFHDTRGYSASTSLISKSTTFLSTAGDVDKSIWYQDIDTIWKRYGKVNSPAVYDDVAVDENTVDSFNTALAVAPYSSTDVLIDTVYFGLDKSQSPMIEYKLPNNTHTASIMHSVAISNGVIYVLTDDNKIYSTTTDDKLQPHWKVVGESSMPFNKDTVITAIAVHDNKLYAAANIRPIYSKIFVIDITE